jgi:low temperature requirement protein LtrA
MYTFLRSNPFCFRSTLTYILACLPLILLFSYLSQLHSNSKMKLRHVLSRQYSEEGVHAAPKSLPLIKSPLEEKDSSFLLLGQIPTEDSESRESQSQEPKGTKTRFRLPSNRHHSNNNADDPHFKVHHEASSIELFYDLFFVANLTTFTANHPIDDRGTLASYMGFFTLLWFTWFQTSLYDVRFSIDSVFSRVCKALHFGVMTGFAIVGPLFQTDEVERDNRAFRSLSIIMMVSRLILVVQYGTVLWFVKGYKRTILPIALLMGILFTTAMIFLGMTFAYGPHKGGKAQDGWYVTAVGETICVLSVSTQWRILSFKRTHLVERVGLLTLIILGEGIIGMTKSVTKIMQGTTVVTGSSIGSVICCVLIIVS